MGTLFTGFKGKRNSSYLLVSEFAGDKLFLTNSFLGLQKDIEDLSESYEKVYMFGLDKSLNSSVRIEKCAEKDGRMLDTSIDTNEIARRLSSNGIMNTTSNHPTHYLCNEAYYYMLIKFDRNVIFIHIPSIKYITQEFILDIIKSLG